MAACAFCDLMGTDAEGRVWQDADVVAFLDQGGVYVNNRKVPDAEATLSTADLLHGRYALLRRGKQSQHLLRVSSGPRGG